MPQSTGAPHERPPTGTHPPRPTHTPWATRAPGAARAAGYPWHLRTSQADRDQVAEQLGHAFAEGRLDQQEFDRRMHAAMTARTHADLARVVADLPPAGGMPPASSPAVTVAPSASDRTLGALCHLSALFASFLGPLLLLLTAGRDSAFVRDQATESLTFQLTFLLANVVLVIGVVVTFGLAALLYIPLGIAWFVLVLVGSVASLQGKAYRYPLNLRLVQ